MSRPRSEFVSELLVRWKDVVRLSPEEGLVYIVPQGSTSEGGSDGEPTSAPASRRARDPPAPPPRQTRGAGDTHVR